MTRHPVTGRLVRRPRPTSVGMTWALRWELAVGDGTSGAGPADVAWFALPSGVVVHSDYADPSRLLQVEVPAGTTADRDAGPVAVAADDVAVVDSLLGEEIAGLLADAADVVEVVVGSRSSWTVAGRIAVAASARRDQHQPLVGLWALEVAELVAGWGVGPSGDAWRTELLDRAAPATSLLPAGLVSRADGDLAPLGHLLAVSSARAERSFGPLADAVVRRNAVAVAAAADRVIEAATPPEPGPTSEWAPPPAPPRVLVQSPMGGASGPVSVERPVLLDHTAHARRITGATATVTGVDLVVDLVIGGPARTTPGALLRHEVAVTSPDGLLARAWTFAPPQDGTIRARLVLPAGTDPDELDVVVGRGLPRGPIDAVAFAERQAAAAARRVVDHLRVMDPPPAGDLGGLLGSGDLVPTALQDDPIEAARGWVAVARPDRARGVAGLRAQMPFTTELTGRSLAVDDELAAVSALADDPDAGPERLAAGRDLLWSLGAVAAAARLERVRYEATGAAALAVAEHDALTLALLDRAPGEAMDLDRRLD